MSYIPVVRDNEIKDEWHNAFLRGYNFVLEELETIKSNMCPRVEVDDIDSDINSIGIIEKMVSEITEKVIDSCVLRLQLTLKEIRCSMADEEFCNREMKEEKQEYMNSNTMIPK